MIGRQRKSACGVCYCSSVWGGGRPVTDSDMFWVVLECTRIINWPVSRPELNDRLTHYGVYAAESERDEQAVETTLLYLVSKGRIKRAAKNGTRETAYVYVHIRKQSLAERIKAVFS